MYGNVLIVDDSKVSRMITKKIVLEISPNISILEAASGDEALELLKSNEPEAAILDFHMPGLTGLELAEKLKDLMPNLVITMLTANIQNEIKAQAEALGVGYLTKPAKKEDLETFLMN